MGVYWIHPDVRLSIHPSVDKVSVTFDKTIGSIHFIPGIYPCGVSILTYIHFCVPSANFGLMLAKNLAENGVSRTFRKTIGSIHFIPNIYPYESLDPAFTIMGWVSRPLYVFIFV